MAEQTDVTKTEVDPVTGLTVAQWIKNTTAEKRNETYNFLIDRTFYYDQEMPNGEKNPALTEGEWGVLAYGIFRDAEVINLGGPTRIWENGNDLNTYLDFVDHVYEPVVNKTRSKTASQSYTNPVTGTKYPLRSYWLSAMGDTVRTEGWQIPAVTGAVAAALIGGTAALGGTVVWTAATGTGAMLASGGATVIGAGTATAAAATQYPTIARALMGLDKIWGPIARSATATWMSKIAGIGAIGAGIAAAASMADNAINPEANAEAEAFAERQAKGLDKPGNTINQTYRGIGDQARPVVEVRDSTGKLIDVQYGVIGQDSDGSPVILPETSDLGSFVPNQGTESGFSFVPTETTGGLSTTPPGMTGSTVTDPLIRVEEDYVAARRAPIGGSTRVPKSRGSQKPTYQTFQVVPKYRDSHIIPQLNTLTDEEVHNFQLMMVDAGLIGEFDYFPGVRDEATEKAMEAVMGQGNVDGSNWQTAARFYQQLGLKQKELAKQAALKARTFVQPAYVAPDYATLSQAVKQTFETLVGRDPHDSELAVLADQMNKDYRKQYQAEIAAQRSEFDAQGRAIVNETDQAAGTFQNVDPTARMIEAIEKKYGPEIEGEEKEDQGLTDISNVLNSFSRLTAFTRGG